MNYRLVQPLQQKNYSCTEQLPGFDGQPRRLLGALNGQGIRIGRYRVRRLMRTHQLKPVCKRVSSVGQLGFVSEKTWPLHIILDKRPEQLKNGILSVESPDNDTPQKARIWHKDIGLQDSVGASPARDLDINWLNITKVENFLPSVLVMPFNLHERRRREK